MRELSGMGTLKCVDFEGEVGGWGAGWLGGNRKTRARQFESKLPFLLSRFSSLRLSQSRMALEPQEVFSFPGRSRERV